MMAAQLPRVIQFPLPPLIAQQRAAAVVRKLQRGDLTVDTSIEHLGDYADRVEWLRHAVSITRGRPA